MLSCSSCCKGSEQLRTDYADQPPKKSLVGSETYPVSLSVLSWYMFYKIVWKIHWKYKQGDSTSRKNTLVRLCSTDSGKLFHFCAWCSPFRKQSVIYSEVRVFLSLTCDTQIPFWVHMLTFITDLVYSFNRLLHSPAYEQVIVLILNHKT